jgi:hypothetical protein
MQRVGIIGGEKHIGEITSLNGRELEISVAAVRPDMVGWARETFWCEVVTNHEELLAREDLDIIAIANENDARGPVVTAAVYCELDDGSAAVVKDQRMLPDTKGSDDRVTIAGTLGYADLLLDGDRLHMTTSAAADVAARTLPEAVSVVLDWLNGGNLVP